MATEKDASKNRTTYGITTASNISGWESNSPSSSAGATFNYIEWTNKNKGTSIHIYMDVIKEEGASICVYINVC